MVELPVIWFMFLYNLMFLCLLGTNVYRSHLFFLQGLFSVKGFFIEKCSSYDFVSWVLLWPQGVTFARWLRRQFFIFLCLLLCLGYFDLIDLRFGVAIDYLDSPQDFFSYVCLGVLNPQINNMFTAAVMHIFSIIWYVRNQQVHKEVFMPILELLFWFRLLYIRPVSCRRVQCKIQFQIYPF